MFVIGTEVVELRHFKTHVGHKGIKATRTQYDAWLAIVGRAQWRTPEECKGVVLKSQHSQG
jgi:mRNA-degrading endonuclease HigB of HigAB toxin-antitoxin module